MNARDYALRMLSDTSLPGWQRDTRLVASLRGIPPADPRDRSLAEQIHTGVVKNLLLLQHLITSHSGRKLRDIDPPVQRILAIGLYQLRFLTRIPPSAAVDEAVAQAKRLRLARASGFVNAVLRNATRNPDSPLPDREKDPREFAHIALSHPPEVFDRYAGIVGPADAIRLCERDNAEPPTIVRLNLGCKPDQLQNGDLAIEPHEQEGMLVVRGAKQATFEKWAVQGVAQVQDPTAANVVEYCDIKPGQTVLDRCAGLGTKTLQLADRVGGKGIVIAVDPAPQRISGLQSLVSRRGLANVRPAQASMLSELNDLPRHFDRILVDAPCSNSGVFPRRPEARYAQDARSLRSLRQLQLSILQDSIPHMADEGLLIYSTCSIWSEENTGVVTDLLQRGLTLVQEHVTLPDLSGEDRRYRDGGYVAVLRKR